MTTSMKVLVGLVVAGAAVSTAALARGDLDVAPRTMPASEPSVRRVAAPGRIEGASDTVALGAAVDGRIAEVSVREGDTVAPGQVLVRIDCAPQEAARTALAARRDGARAARSRLRDGGRADARREAQAQVGLAEAALEQARGDERRASALWSDRVISRQEFDRAVTAARLAEAAAAAARERLSMTVAEPRADDLREMDARVRELAAQVAEADARLAQCVVRAPQAGTVLRVVHHAGETVSAAAREPIVIMADTRHLRVRAEVDEDDATRIHVGASTAVSADAFDEAVLRGRVVALLPTLGRRTVLSGDPADKSDRDVREVLVELEPSGVPAVVGLRVRVLFGR